VGAWAWNDVQTTDVDGALAFYRALFGWDIAEAPGSGGRYFSISHGGRTIGGVMPAPPGVPRASWSVYFGVDSAGAALERAEAAGGQRLVAPIDVPAGRFAVASDPLGAAFAVVEGDFDD
jgi:predicted enzyme related to lactoylglutathione lyase